MSHLPLEHCIYLCIAGHYGNDRTKEDLTIEDGMVQVSTLHWAQTKQDQLGLVPSHHTCAQILEEVECRALVELLLRMLENPEDEGLWAGKDEGGQICSEHHQPEKDVIY